MTKSKNTFSRDTSIGVALMICTMLFGYYLGEYQEGKIIERIENEWNLPSTNIQYFVIDEELEKYYVCPIEKDSDFSIDMDQLSFSLPKTQALTSDGKKITVAASKIYFSLSNKDLSAFLNSENSKVHTANGRKYELSISDECLAELRSQISTHINNADYISCGKVSDFRETVKDITATLIADKFPEIELLVKEVVIPEIY